MATRDLSAALDFAAHAATVRDYDDVRTILLPHLCRFVDAPAAVLHEVDLARGEESNLFFPDAMVDLDAIAAYADVQHAHPFFVVAAGGGVVLGLRLSDLMTRRTWRSSAVYSQALSRLRTEDQMTTTLRRRGPLTEGVSLVTDGRSFTARQRALLLLVRPHLTAALARLHCPGAVHRVLTVGPTPAWRTVACAAGRTASVTGTGGLTVAERRVLAEVAAGLTNAQIASRSGVARRTVDKHLEHAYAKLGVTNRMAAVSASGLVPLPRPSAPSGVISSDEAPLPGCLLSCA
ncbi:helix-turn-helix transcriptional regulator [Aquipuribacter sp. SD81]|uniref:helix-turn-helix transcriptional regulator n=1 Tax=Aquipuribacter sp. SD81 TaxID=3127703 RepID=UPI00301A2769